MLNASLASAVQSNHFRDLTKVVIQGESAVLTGQHRAVYRFREVLPAEVQLPAIPKLDTILIYVLDILKFLVFRRF